MTDQVHISEHGAVTHTGEAIARYQMIAVRRGLHALKIGMKVNRAYTAKNLLAMVGGWTGKTYKGAAKLDDAIADVTTLIAATEKKIEFTDDRPN
ncbi:hypothetical protein MARCHEWKA_01310 [Brevundimonas phage vB_BpoS-Marchewka]|uniref:Uncharacterized protein n=1 Tax=Brevundimonas phage vB_BpoS-Marchewka TaxID=2948604 RepID=A0A9E7N2G6_9CAUD|nr:hypothetical protein MARCHEWKA_01310 [Brevundimonas phage vB_BpoS-Marchewka]